MHEKSEKWTFKSWKIDQNTKHEKWKWRKWKWRKMREKSRKKHEHSNHEKLTKITNTIPEKNENKWRKMKRHTTMNTNEDIHIEAITTHTHTHTPSHPHTHTHTQPTDNKHSEHMISRTTRRAIWFQISDGPLNHATHNACHTSLLPSSQENSL